MRKLKKNPEKKDFRKTKYKIGNVVITLFIHEPKQEPVAIQPGSVTF